MRRKEALDILSQKDFLDKLYGFSYKRCNTSCEAEDLCSEIILSVLKSLEKNDTINNFYAFVWTIARRVYADFCSKKSKTKIISYTDEIMNIKTNTINEFSEQEDDKENIKVILCEITFLSKIYRDVMVMYYIDELSINEIANKINISETSVKQRLFSARNNIKKEIIKMDKNLTLKPVDIAFIGTGNPTNNDPRVKAERVLSKNVIYLCKKDALSAKEISEKLSVPMPFIEDELEILVKGENGEYGLLKKLDNGKYISNFILLDLSEYNEASCAFTDSLDEICELTIQYFKNHKQEIEAFPFINTNKDIKFIAWCLISDMIWAIDKLTNRYVSENYLKDIKITKRPFSTVGIANNKEEDVDLYFYGCDGNKAENLCGYKNIYFRNSYGYRLDKHYSCGHNLSTDPQFMMLLRSIKGINLNELSEEEKEIIAKTIESGLIEKVGNVLKPKIVTIFKKSEKEFFSLINDFEKDIQPICEKIAKKLVKLINKTVPKHLKNEYNLFTMLASTPLVYCAIEKCIEKGILQEPVNRLCAESCLLIVQD